MGGHERAAALTAVDQAFALQALVDGTDCVDVDSDGVGELAYPRQPLAWREAPIANAAAQCPAQLHADRDLTIAVYGGGEPIRFEGLRLCIHIITVALAREKHGVLVN